MSDGGGDELHLSLAELAKRSGVSRRTIRYYIGRGLLPRPESTGRGAHYGEQHVELLERVKDLKSQGYTLSEIGAGVGGTPEGAPVPEPQALWSYRVSPDVVVTVRSDVTPWRHRRIKDALAEMVAKLSTSRDPDGGGRGGDLAKTQGGTGK